MNDIYPRTLSAEEFEHLALTGRTPAGDLIVGEGGAERVLLRAKQLAMPPDDILDVYVPGRLRCRQCGFELTRATLFAQSGEVGASKAEVYIQAEPCPNDGTLMDRVSWREEADRNREYAEKLIAEIIDAVGVESLPQAMESIKMARAEALAAASVQPGTTLNAAWERFSEQELPPVDAPVTVLSQFHLDEAALLRHTARRAFYAGAQTFVGIIDAALSDQEDEYLSQMEAAYKELEQAVEEMKL